MTHPSNTFPQHHPVNWTPILVIVGILIFAALAFIGYMMYMDHEQTVKDNSPGAQSQFNTGQPSQPTVDKVNSGPIPDDQCLANLKAAKAQHPDWDLFGNASLWAGETGCSKDQVVRLQNWNH